MARISDRVDQLAELDEQVGTEQAGTEQAPAARSSTAPLPRQGPVRAGLAFLRNTWRGLTSMRTALILLFLLALAALPGALLPQRMLNPPKTAKYIAEHGWWGTLLDKLQFFGVYSSVWFSAIYVLLFVSLIGCLLPRSVDFLGQLRSKPVLTPRNFTRLPHHHRSTVELSVEQSAEHAQRALSGWRVVRRSEPGGVVTLSAEKGFLREVGNLVFHFAMLGLIIAFALGKMFSYSGQVAVIADGSQFCNSGVYNYDSFTPGLQVDGTDLAQFCLRVNSFQATYQKSGEALHYQASLDYQDRAHLASDTWQHYELLVNHPLRIVGDRIYLLGNGYAPVFRVRFPNGKVRTSDLQWQPVDPNTMLSTGATTFDPPGVSDQAQLRRKQLAITGLFAPTALVHGGVMTSSAPALHNPGVAVDIYQGDLGDNSGASHSIYSIDQQMVDQGRLKRQERVNLLKGQSTTLKDGTKITLVGVKRFVSLQINHDPTELWVLVFAVAMLFGLGASLIIKRRR
ncbi:MAG: cytochrome c biogenesis protein ResB, partial [Sciscionella sp.]